nr:cyclic nucleotide-binding domain-containing protein [uncultured Desulfobacter sp.]
MNRREIVEVLKKIEPFNTLGNDVLENLSAIVSVNKFKPRTYIFKKGEPSLEALFILVSGLLELTVTSDRGFESVVGLRKPGDFFSEAVVLSGQPYPVSARVREDLICIKIHRRDLEILIYNHPSFFKLF